MTLEEVWYLIGFGQAIDIKVTPAKVDGVDGVNYLDFQSSNYGTVLRDLLTLKAQKEARQ